MISCPVRANWHPEPEPIFWSQLRKTHLPGGGWTFVDAMAKPQLQAAEYLRSPRVSTTRSDGIVVEIEAASINPVDYKMIGGAFFLADAVMNHRPGFDFR